MYENLIQILERIEHVQEVRTSEACQALLPSFWPRLTTAPML